MSPRPPPGQGRDNDFRFWPRQGINSYRMIYFFELLLTEGWNLTHSWEALLHRKGILKKDKQLRVHSVPCETVSTRM